MKFEIINDKNKVVMHTTHVCCVPEKDILISMSRAGYKFKMDGKSATIKKIAEQLKGLNNEENNQN